MPPDLGDHLDAPTATEPIVPHVPRFDDRVHSKRATLRQRDLPSAPMAKLMDIVLAEASEGWEVFEATASEFHYNPIGIVHGGFAATLLDSAMGCAVRPHHRARRRPA